jgi:hypothetical protein
MKRILLTASIAASLLLSACGASTTGATVDSNPPFYTYETAEFTMEVPLTWEVITAFPSEYPQEIRVAFRNNVKDRDFVANLSVIREDGTRTNMDHAQKKLSDHESTLLNFALLTQEELTLGFAGGESATILNSFEGKNGASAPLTRFMQTYLSKGNKLWTVTASYDPSEDDFTVERMDTMLRTFTLK